MVKKVLVSQLQRTKAHDEPASPPQYEIKSAKTDHIAFHKGSALTKLGD
jgi:hypothetical protein